MPLQAMKTQELFETLWFHKDAALPALEGTRPVDRGWLMYHTAKWCGACRHVDVPAVVSHAETFGLTVWKVDQDENDYTSGYCGVRSIPTWQFCVPGKIVSTLQSNDTQKINAWVDSLHLTA